MPTPQDQVEYDLVVQAASSIGLITRTRRYGHPDEGAARMVHAAGIIFSIHCYPEFGKSPIELECCKNAFRYKVL